jgi:hypothetical protein
VSFTDNVIVNGPGPAFTMFGINVQNASQVTTAGGVEARTGY